MQVTKANGQLRPVASARQTSSGSLPLPSSRSSLESIIDGIAQDLGFRRYNLPSTLTTQQAAKVLHVSVETLALWRSKGRYNLSYQKTGRFVRYPVSSIAEFIQSRTYTHTGGAA